MMPILADILPPPSAQGWWDGWKFLIALMGFGVLGMQLLSYFRRTPPVDVDIAKLRAEFLTTLAFEQHRQSRDTEIASMKREFSSAIAEMCNRIDGRFDQLRLETKNDLISLHKKLSIEVAGVHDRANDLLAAVSELRGEFKGKNHNG